MPDRTGGVYSQRVPLHPDRRFRETGVGCWEDVPFGWLERFDKSNMDDFNHNERVWQVTGSETWDGYTSRFLQGLHEIAAQNDGKTIAIFTHACVLRGVQKRLLKTDELPFCENTAVSRLCWRDGEITFDFLNDASHLSPEISTMQRQPAAQAGRDGPRGLQPVVRKSAGQGGDLACKAAQQNRRAACAGRG